MDKQVVGGLALPPGLCALCDQSVGGERGIVDTGRDIRFYGRVYVCGDCIDECSSLLGRLHPNKIKRLVAHNDKLEAANAELIEKNESLEQLVSDVANDHVKQVLADTRKILRKNISEDTKPK